MTEKNKGKYERNWFLFEITGHYQHLSLENGVKISLHFSYSRAKGRNSYFKYCIYVFALGCTGCAVKPKSKTQ